MSGVDLSFRFGVSVLGAHVAVVIQAGSEKQMFRVHAGRVVAGVANEQTVRNGAPVKFERKPMRPVDLVADAKIAVTEAAARATPEPAIALRAVTWPLVDLVPKAR